MVDAVTCVGCGKVLEEPAHLNSGERNPCPHCGSISRIVLSPVVIGGKADLDVHLKAVGSFLEKPPLEILLQQTITVHGGRTREGVLIQAVAIPWFEIIRHLERDPTAAFEIPPRIWEEIIAGSYKKAGYDEVILTPHSGDGGRDVIAVKKGFCTVRFIEQVKRYSPGHLVTAQEVRALMGVLAADMGASKGVVTTTSDFAPKITEDPAIKPWLPYRLELINGKKLLERFTEWAK